MTDIEIIDIAERAAKRVYARGGRGAVVREAGQTAMELLRFGASEETVMAAAETCPI